MFCICLTFAGDDPYSSSTQYKEEKTAGISDAYMGLRSFFIVSLEKNSKNNWTFRLLYDDPDRFNTCGRKKREKSARWKSQWRHLHSNLGHRLPFLEVREVSSLLTVMKELITTRARTNRAQSNQELSKVLMGILFFSYITGFVRKSNGRALFSAEK